MESVPELRMETEDRQSAEYEVHHQKLVNKHRAADLTSTDPFVSADLNPEKDTQACRQTRIKVIYCPLLFLEYTHGHRQVHVSSETLKVVAMETCVHGDDRDTVCVTVSLPSKSHCPLI